MLKKLFQMGFWKLTALVLSACGSIWAARCLGPTKLGISGMVVAYGMQAGLLINMGIGPLLVRDYKNPILINKREIEKMISNVISYRVFTYVVIAVPVVAYILLAHVDRQWWLSISMMLVIGFITALNSDWILQAEDNQVVQQKISTLCGFISAILMVSFIRHGAPAGSELVVLCVITIISFVISWRIAISGKYNITLSVKNVISSLPMIFKGKWLLISSIFVYIYIRLEVPMIGWLNSVEEVGKYKSALQILNGVEPLIGLFPALLYPRMIDWSKLGLLVLWKNQKSIMVKIVTFGLPCVVLSFLIIPRIYPLIYGDKFKEAAIPCCILITSKFFVLLNSIFGWGLWSVGKDFTMMVIMGIVAFFSISLNLLVIPKYGIMGASIINAVSEFLILLACGYFQYLHCHGKQSVHPFNN